MSIYHTVLGTSKFCIFGYYKAIIEWILTNVFFCFHMGYSRLLATKRSNKMDSSFTCKLYVKFLENIINLKNFKMIDSVKNIKP